MCAFELLQSWHLTKRQVCHVVVHRNLSRIRLKLVSFAAVIRVVMHRSSPLTAAHSPERRIPFPLLLRTNNMHVLASSPQIIFLFTVAAKDQVSRKWKPAPYWSIWGKE